jgi:hypothetical protein
MTKPPQTTEHARLESGEGWDRWGPYLAERAWGTVREDYSADGDAWRFFPHDHARWRVYRWNEDGLAGICDDHQYLCFALALWNGHDPILKERMFGLDMWEGNHGEDVKEYYYFTDATPTHSYLRMRYRYPQAEYPYRDLTEGNATRGLWDPEYELLDTGVMDGNRYFDVDVEYAKAAVDDVVVRITVTNQGPEDADIHVLPTLWFRNTWSWGYPQGPMDDVPRKPSIELGQLGEGWFSAVADHPVLGTYRMWCAGSRDLWFTENESAGSGPYTKGAFHHRLVGGDGAAVNPRRTGTKAASWHHLTVPARGSRSVMVRLAAADHAEPFAGAADLIERRRAEADEFYAAIQPDGIDPDRARIHREACAGLIWTKQLYYYDVEQWLDGDPLGPPPPERRGVIRNGDWRHVNNFDIVSMPDSWEYPWYAAWDLAFHCVPLALIDPAFAKGNLRLMTREWYMHPNGALPAYEWAFENVNPPVFAWATRRVYELDGSRGEPDHDFLEAMFHKLLLNFTWWVNRKDVDGNNVFQGGFLGMDNVSLFDRSVELPTGGHIDQSDGTAWMGFATLGMLKIALELAALRPAYQDVATKFYEHFLAIAQAMNFPGHSLWDPEDGFFYDVLHLPDGTSRPLRVRSMVGLLPLIAVEVIEPDVLDRVPEFTARMAWLARHKPHLKEDVATMTPAAAGHRHLLAMLNEERLRSVLRYMLDPDEFLSPYGVRSLSKVHAEEPFTLAVGGADFTIGYEPGESRSHLFGGNSNWRGPIWFPINYLIVEALREYATYYGEDFTVEHPVGSGRPCTLNEVADDLSQRLISLFLPGSDGSRPVHGAAARAAGAAWEDELLFYEYFHGETGEGLGASHQTGWTALVAKLINELGGR